MKTIKNHKDNNYPEFSQFLSDEEKELVMDYQDSIFLSELLKIIPEKNIQEEKAA